MPSGFFEQNSQKKDQNSPSNFAYSKKPRYQISTETKNFEFLDQINPKKVFLI